jgi:acyl-coenzyme A thioesterase PaaI-like protein
VQRIRESFNRQEFMRTLGAVLESVESGTVTISCAFGDGLTQQHGLFHGSVVASLVDVACGYAALSDGAAPAEIAAGVARLHFANSSGR